MDSARPRCTVNTLQYRNIKYRHRGFSFSGEWQCRAWVRLRRAGRHISDNPTHNCTDFFTARQGDTHLPAPRCHPHTLRHSDSPHTDPPSQHHTRMRHASGMGATDLSRIEATCAGSTDHRRQNTHHKPEGNPYTASGSMRPTTRTASSPLSHRIDAMRPTHRARTAQRGAYRIHHSVHDNPHERATAEAYTPQPKKATSTHTKSVGVDLGAAHTLL